VVFVATAVIMAAAYSAYYLHVFGQATPLAVYGGMPTDASGSPLLASLGLLLDRSFGLLPFAPIFLLALAGLPLLAHPGRLRLASGWPVLLVGLAVLLPVLPWRMWWGGQCPPARFLVPLVPTLAVAVALRATGPPRGLLRWRTALFTLGASLVFLAAFDPGRLLLLSRANVAPRLWEALAGGASPAAYLPSLTRPDPAEWRVAALWVMTLLVLLALDHLARTREPLDRLFRGLGLPLVLLLALSLGVDYWARAERIPLPAELIGVERGVGGAR
jgi:hypothetical protein